MLCHRRREESTSFHCRKNWFGCGGEWEQFVSSSCWGWIRAARRPGVCSWLCAQFDCHSFIKAIRHWHDACIQLEHNHRSVFHRDRWLDWCAAQSTQYRSRCYKTNPHVWAASSVAMWENTNVTCHYSRSQRTSTTWEWRDSCAFKIKHHFSEQAGLCLVSGH